MLAAQQNRETLDRISMLWAAPMDKPRGEQHSSPDEVVARVRQALEQAVPGIRLVETRHTEYIRLVIPTDSESDYSFWACVYAAWAEASLGAELFNDSDAYFWGQSLEDWEYSTTSQLANRLTSTLVCLASNPTRIQAVKSLLSIGFTLEYGVGGGWSQLPGNAAFRYSNFRVPSLPADRIWRSQPFGPGRSV